MYTSYVAYIKTINTINIEIRYFDIKKFPRYNILSNEISRYFQNIEILPSTTLIFTIMNVLKFLMMKIGSNITTTSMLFIMMSFRKFRHLAYRQLVWWGWQHLGRQRLVVFPSCAVGKIRDEFSSPLGEYTGHQYPPSTP